MTNTNNGCACTPNQSIKCTVTNCAHHCQDQNYCGLNAITVGTLGHARPAVTFDLLFRYLQALGYKVRYVRNITDVGHLEHDADDGEDKITKKLR